MSNLDTRRAGQQTVSFVTARLESGKLLPEQLVDLLIEAARADGVVVHIDRHGTGSPVAAGATDGRGTGARPS
jgi:hypothetical protein